jgi:hypothetical protein
VGLQADLRRGADLSGGEDRVVKTVLGLEAFILSEAKNLASR